MKNFLVILLVLMWIISCKKQEINSELNSQWVNCRDKNDKNNTFLKMIGKWKLVATGCSFCTNPGIKNTTEQIEIVILKDSTVQAYKDKNLISAYKFVLEDSYNPGYFKLETIPANKNYYTYGVIEQCENKLVFKNSYVDGGDYFFESIK